MKLFHFAAIVSVFCTFAGLAATPAANKAAPKTTPKTAPKTDAKKSTAKAKAKTVASKAPPSAKGKAAKGPAKAKEPAVTWRTRQQNPTSDRYREIQQALVTKGYLKNEPTGVWDADSTAAMQHFQQDQKLNPSGKINAPTLIGLGLGSKSAGAPEAPALPGAPPPLPPQTESPLTAAP